MTGLTRWQKLFVVGLFAMAAARAVAGQGQTAPVDERFRTAQDAYNAQDYNKANFLLGELIDGLSNSLSTPEAVQRATDLYEWRARTRLQLRDTEGARADFQALLMRKPEYAVPDWFVTER